MTYGNHYYDICCRYKGKHVRIVDLKGLEHHGKIVDVDNKYVYLEKEGRGYSGFGYGYGGYYPGYGYPGYTPYPYRPVVPIALAAIGGFALGAAFFW
ncbi:hypothetical protein CR203_10590 [Salipaludibacillus neizhouensis]|uniref:Uncharacterized protein n=1 Tax=Salipaludibacillus neizhouensis TaxID=885475 RepID=A0A3A9KB63_9BACI|nr:hypothetical protein [Salipaludibacillus neizhouensis]RKL67782.1 hypothetical protein CR203_10590 [Salipaludibacillus neizhouensis]